MGELDGEWRSTLSNSARTQNIFGKLPCPHVPRFSPSAYLGCWAIFFFIKLICWLRDTHKKGGNSAPFVRQWDCHGMGPQLEQRDLHQNRVPIFPRRNHRSQQVGEKVGKWRRREGTSTEACSSCWRGLHHRQRVCTSGFTCHLHTLFHFFPSGHTPAAHACLPARRSATHTNHLPKSAFRGGGLNLTVSLLLRSPPSIVVPSATCFYTRHGDGARLNA